MNSVSKEAGKYGRKMFLALQFLTIIPVTGINDVSDSEAGGSSVFFPLVGFMEGILFVLFSAAFLTVLGASLTNGLLLVAMVALNGGLHLDGLADTFDAIALRGERKRKLESMKDGTVGPVGAASIFLVLFVKYLSLNAIYSISISCYFLSLLLMPIFSRWTMVSAIYHGIPAKNTGLGTVFIYHTELSEFIISTVITLFFLITVAGTLQFMRPVGCTTWSLIFFLLVVLGFLYGFSYLFDELCNNVFGGMTGDTFGAVSELSGVVVLICLVAVGHYCGAP